PSAGARKTASVARLLAAPGLLSIMNDCPSRSVSAWHNKRVKISVPPPGAYPTITRTGREGYACARAVRETAGSAAAPAARCRNRRRGSFISIPPSLVCLFDHLVGNGDQHRRDFEAERLRSL